MSDCSGPSSNHSRGSASRGDKPNHVKRLNFGWSVLELDVATQCGSSRTLVIDQNVAGIPCTKKKDYVRKWIETHGRDGGEGEPSSDLSSPILGTSVTKTGEGSPVLGNSAKRRRTGIRINRHVVAATKSASNADHLGRNAVRSANYTARCRQDCESKDKNRNEECPSETQCIPCHAEEAIAGGSPVLGMHLYKRRRRRLQYGPEDCISPKRLKFRDSNSCKITNVSVNSIIEPDNAYDTLGKISISCDSEGNSDSNVKETIFPIEMIDSPEKLQNTEAFSSQTPERLSSEDSSNNNNRKDNLKIETGTSEDEKEEGSNKLSSRNNSSNNSPNNSSNNSPNNFIEEVDTQDTLPTKNVIHPSYKSPPISRQPSKSSQLTDLNETYCSETEKLLDQSTHLSAKISLVPSLSKEATATQTVVISSITTPSKASPDKAMHARLLNSGKKRRKPKKGSMVAKLQFLINTEISSIRIWRYRKNKHDAASTRFIRVLVHDCLKQFSNQFLRGVLIEDRFNLLQSDVEIEEVESPNIQASTKKTVTRDVTIMLVCDIAGTLKMISEVVINVYPPWEVLDKTDLILEATYISLNDNHEVPDIAKVDFSRKREKQIVKEFNCPCIEEDRELPFCARKPSADKPDVMQQIFNF